MIDSESDCYFVAAASRIFVMVVIMIELGGLVFMQISKIFKLQKERTPIAGFIIHSSMLRRMNNPSCTT